MDETRNPQQPAADQPAPAHAPPVPAAESPQPPADPYARPEPVTDPQPANPFASPEPAQSTGQFAYPPAAPSPYQPPINQPYQQQPAGFPAYGQGYGQQPYGNTATIPTAPPAGIPPHQQPPRRRFAAGIAVGAIALALVSGVTGSAATLALSDNDGNGAAPVITREVSPASAKTTAPGTVEAAAAAITPSVVTLRVTGSEGGRSAQGTGSGVVMREDGHILTNNHVVAPAANGGTVQVFFSDGSSKEAKIVGRDPSNDLAVVKVSGASGLKAATFADSGSLKIGQPVLAVGAPLGLSGTVTQGIISAVNRPVRTGDGTGQDAVIDAIQTDAPINPGNSGGALVDLNGRVIGVNSAIATVGGGDSGIPGQSSQSGNIGVGFAIPADDAVQIAQQLISEGKASHATLGVSAQDSTEGAGATVMSVVSGSPASKLGLREGDVITAVASRRVVDVDSLVAAVRDHKPGDKVTITYTRAGKTAKGDATLTAS
jgi:putative serine protease PepD